MVARSSRVAALKHAERKAKLCRANEIKAKIEANALRARVVELEAALTQIANSESRTIDRDIARAVLSKR